MVRAHAKERKKCVSTGHYLCYTQHAPPAPHTPAFCGDEKFGEQKKKKCLFAKRLDADFGSACKGAVEKEMGFEAKDARLNAGLSALCEKDLAALCPAAAAATAASEDRADGSSIECLAGKLAEIKNRGCRREVARVSSVQAEIWNANVKVAPVRGGGGGGHKFGDV